MNAVGERLARGKRGGDGSATARGSLQLAALASSLLASDYFSNNSLTSTEKATAIASTLSMDMFRSPLSTEPKVRWSPHSSARCSCDQFAAILLARMLRATRWRAVSFALRIRRTSLTDDYRSTDYE